MVSPSMAVKTDQYLLLSSSSTLPSFGIGMMCSLLANT